MTERTDQDLVDACLLGDEEAWSALVSRYRGLMYSVPLRFGLRGDRADEVFQRTCVSMLRALRTVREVKRLAGWVSATAANHARMCLREERGRITVEPEAIASRDEDVATDLRRLEDAQILGTALERLDDRCRGLIDALFFAPGRVSYREISRRFDLPIGSIGPTRARCLEKLRRLLREAGFTE